MESPVTRRVLALVLQRLGDAEFNPVSDRALARLLKISHTHAARLRANEYRLDRAAFLRALRYLDLPADETMELSAQLDAELLDDSTFEGWFMQRVRAHSADVASFAKATGQTVKNSKTLRRAKGAAALTGAAILAVLSMNPEPARASTYEPPTERTSHEQSIHYAKYRRRGIPRRGGPQPHPFERKRRFRVPRRYALPPAA